MPSPKETFRSVRERLRVGHLVTASTIWVTPTVGAPMSSGVAYAIRESQEYADPDIVRILAIAAIAVMNTKSVAQEIKAINQEGNSGSNSTNLLYLATGKTTEASIGGHFIGATTLTLFSSGVIAAFKGEIDLEDTTYAALFTSASMRIGLNSLILSRGTVVRGTRRAKDWIARRGKKEEVTIEK